MPKSTYLANKTLDDLYGSGDPASIFFALYTAAPNAAGGGTEVSGTGYSRKSITNNETNFPDAADGAKTTGTAVTFPQAGSNWGEVVAVATFDAVDGNMLHFTTLADPRGIFLGDLPNFPAGSVSFEES